MPNMRSPKSPSPMLTKNSTIGVGVLMRRAAAAPIKSAGRADRLRPLGTVHDPFTIAKRCLVKPVLAAGLVSSLAAGEDIFFVLDWPDGLAMSV